MSILTALTLILSCQLAGEMFVVLTRVPVPGPVVGMLLLFAGLLLRGGAVPAGLETVGSTLLSHMALLFVPAGVGIMVHGPRLGGEGIAIAVAIVLGTALTLVLVGGSVARLFGGSSTLPPCSHGPKAPGRPES